MSRSRPLFLILSCPLRGAQVAAGTIRRHEAFGRCLLEGGARVRNLKRSYPPGYYGLWGMYMRSKTLQSCLIRMFVVDSAVLLAGKR